jgi:hypothetical protein
MPLQGGMAIPLDASDPHFALGMEHVRAGEPIYHFQDAENQRRYLAGRDRGARFMDAERMLNEDMYEKKRSLDNFKLLAKQLVGNTVGYQQTPPWRQRP